MKPRCPGTQGRGSERLTCISAPPPHDASEGRAAPPPNSWVPAVGTLPKHLGARPAAVSSLLSGAFQQMFPVPPLLPPTSPPEDCLVLSPRSSLRCRSPYFQAPACASRISFRHAVPSRQRSKQPAGFGAHQARLTRPPLLATTVKPPKGLPGTFRGLGGASALPF